MNLLNKVIKQIAFILVLIFSISTVYGQLNKTVGTRITDVTTDKELKTNAILDLESTSKGFFLPRMTTVQRDAIKKDMGKDNGLAVYNIDNDCVEYWSERADKWMSLCGSLPPAKLDLEENSCETIQFVGFTMIDSKPQLRQGVAIDTDTQWMTVRLKVNQIGTYTISANSNNGYFFSGEGQFQSIGTYTIVMKAMGTPIKGYSSEAAIKGDKLQFSLNGVDSKVCTNVEVLVVPAELDFIITSIDNKAKGEYNVGVGATLKNKNSIEIGIEVSSDGLATVTAFNDVLGVKFTGSKNVNANDKTLILEPLLGENTPKENDLEVYNLTFEVNTKDAKKTINGRSATLVVEKTRIKAIFKDVNLGKETYYQGEPLNEKHTIDLPVKVINSGKTNLYLKGSNLEFIAKDVILTMPSNADDTQLVKFKAVTGKVLPEQATVNLTLSGDGKRFEISDDKVLSLPLEKKPVAYTLDCSSVKTNRGAMPYNKPIGTNYYIIAQVDVTAIGEYEINTSSPVDGISFSTSINGKKKVFTETGRQSVELYPIDGNAVPKNKGEYSTNLVTNDMPGVTCPNIKLKVGYVEINVLIIRHLDNSDARDPGESLFLSGKNSNGESRFGETGTYVETGDVKITTWSMTKGNWAKESATYAADINADKYNFIIITNTNTWMSIDDNLGLALTDYVKREGVLVYALPGIIGVTSERNYFTALDDMSASSSVMGKKYNGGMNLLKFLIGGATLPINTFRSEPSFTANVVDQEHPLSKAKYGVDYAIKSGSIYYDVYWYSIEDMYKAGFDVSRTNLVSLVADRGAMYKDKRGVILGHKTYSNVIIAPIITSWYSSPMKINNHVDIVGEPYKNGLDNGGRFGAKTQGGLFIANVYIGLMERIANK